MERLTAYSYAEIIGIVLLAALIIIAEAAAFCRGFGRFDRHRIRRSLPELAAISITLCSTLLLGGSWKLFLIGLPPDGWMVLQRWWAGLFAVAAGLYSATRRPWRGGLLTERASSPCRSSIPSCPTARSSFWLCSRCGSSCSSAMRVHGACAR